MSYQPKTVVGLRVPLFDRLVDGAPDQAKKPAPLRVYTREALHASIARDLGRLLNARRSSQEPFDPARATVLDYGLPSFSHLSAASAIDRRLLAESVRATAAFFEPRIRDISVELEPDNPRPSTMLGWIHCNVLFGSLMEPVTFPLVVESSEGIVEVLTSMSSETMPTIHNTPDQPHG